MAEVPKKDEVSGKSLSSGDENGEGLLGKLVGTIAVLFVLFHLYTTAFGLLPNIIQRSIHVGFGLTIIFLSIPTRKLSRKGEGVDWVLTIATLTAVAYVVVQYDWIMMNPGISSMIDWVLGILIILAVLESSRRSIGLVFPIIAGIFILYALFGNLIPGVWGHAGFSIKMMVERLYLSTEGMWGFVTGISASIVSMFIILSGVFFITGAGQTFIDIAIWLTGRSIGGPAKAAVVSSALFGTISGSSVANVATTGTFTIPMMKSQGYSSEFAAATEATASSGGQIMPPIMGAGAFIMAELIGVSYTSIAFSALLPALLYFTGVFAGVHFEAKRLGLMPSRGPRAPFTSVVSMKKMVNLFIPIAVLIYFLALKYTPPKAAFWSAMSAILLHLIVDRKPFRTKFIEIIDAFKMAGRDLASIASLLVCAQIVVGMVGLTGSGVKISQVIISLSEGSLFLALLLSMFVVIILGMGIATAGAYVVGAAVMAPVLITVGVSPLPAHMFIFYFAVMSAITPPICPAVFVGAGLAKSDWLKTAWIAMRLGLSAFVVPFMFIYNQSILLIGKGPLGLAYDASTAFLGVWFLSMGAIGYSQKSSLLERGLLIAAGLLMIKPGMLTDSIGILLAVLAYLLHRYVFVGRAERRKEV